MFGRGIENFYIDSIRGNKRGALSRLLLLLLFPFSSLYRLAISVRNRLYDRGWLKTHRPEGAVVVSIGNIAVGGTGKTPLAIQLAKQLARKGEVAILSRGYRSPAEKRPLSFKGEGLSASLCGDEPLLLASSLPEARIFVGKDRVRSAKEAAAMGITTLLLDDGMQHRRLHRDFEIAVIDGSRPLTEERLLPSGILREGPEALQRADLIVANHVHTEKEAERVRRELSRFAEAPLLFCRPVVDAVVDLSGEPAELEGKSAGLFCGIANPPHFLQLLKSLNVRIVDRLLVGDHKTCGEAELAAFAEKCKAKGAFYLVCTEKDRIKFPKQMKLPLKMLSVRIKLEITEGEAEWKALLKKIENRCGSVK